MIDKTENIAAFRTRVEEKSKKMLEAFQSAKNEGRYAFAQQVLAAHHAYESVLENIDSTFGTENES